MFAAGRALKLRLNDLFDTVGSDFDDSFIVNLAGARDPQYVLARNDRSQHYSSGSTHAAMAFIVHINFRTLRRHDDEWGIAS